MRKLGVPLGLLALALLAAALAPPAHARSEEAYKTARGPGFSLSVPSSWRTRAGVGPVKLFAAARRREAGVFTNANVVLGAARGQTPLSAWRRRVVGELRASGFVRGTPRARVIRLPAGTAIEVEYRGSVTGHRLHWLAYVIDARARSYVVTFTAAEAAYARHARSFVRMARSFRIR